MSLHDFATLFAMAQPAGERPSLFVQFLPLILILGIFYVVLWLPMKRRQNKIREFQSSLKVGDKIVTTSGIYGAVTKLHDKSVQVQIAERVRVEISRSAIGGYQGQDPLVQDGSGS